jgi:hypothetical protein
MREGMGMGLLGRQRTVDGSLALCGSVTALVSGGVGSRRRLGVVGGFDGHARTLRKLFAMKMWGTHGPHQPGGGGSAGRNARTGVPRL